MREFFLALLAALGVLIGLPILVYFSVKLGVLGYCSGRRLFQELQEKDNERP